MRINQRKLNSTSLSWSDLSSQIVSHEKTSDELEDLTFLLVFNTFLSYIRFKITVSLS